MAKIINTNSKNCFTSMRNKHAVFESYRRPENWTSWCCEKLAHCKLLARRGTAKEVLKKTFPAM